MKPLKHRVNDQSPLHPPSPSIDYPYIRFVRIPAVWTGRGVCRFTVQNIRHGEQLGGVWWSRARRQYVFEPFGRTVYSAGCLADIQDFLRAMADQKAKRGKGR